MDSAVVEILIRAKELGLDAIRNARDQINELRTAVERNAAALLGASPAAREYAKVTGDEGEAAKNAKQQADDLRQAVEKYASILGLSAPAVMANIAATIQQKSAYTDLRQAVQHYAESMGIANAAAISGAAAQSANATSTAAAATSANAAGGSFLGMGYGTLFAVGAVVALTAALSPFLLVLAGAIVILSAFVVGLVAVGTALTLSVGLLGGMAAAVVLLGDRLFTTGKIMSDPLLGLESNLSRMADTWGRQALPMALQIIQWLNSLIPQVQAAGSAILTWFGGRIGEVLMIAEIAFNDLAIAAKTFAAVMGPIVDQMIASTPQWQAFFQTLLLGSAQAFAGLLKNLLALSQWFLERWPQMQPILQQIAGAIGTFVQEAAKKLGELVDWFIKNWPQIKKNAEDAWKAIQDGWKDTKPLIDEAIALFKQMQPLLDFLKQHGDLVKEMFFALGVVLAGAVAVLIVAAAVVIALAAAIVWLHDRTQDVITAIGNLFSLLGRFGDVFWTAAQAMFPWLAQLHNAVGLLGQLIGAAARLAGIGAPAVAGGSEVGIGSYQSGGVVSGPIGAPQLAIVHGGETVIPVGGAGSTMDDTNELLALIYQVLQARLSPPSMSTAAYGRPTG